MQENTLSHAKYSHPPCPCASRAPDPIKQSEGYVASVTMKHHKQDDSTLLSTPLTPQAQVFDKQRHMRYAGIIAITRPWAPAGWSADERVLKTRPSDFHAPRRNSIPQYTTMAHTEDRHGTLANKPNSKRAIAG
jgi:hypothetical protein